jgi:hypothetical protein
MEEHFLLRSIIRGKSLLVCFFSVLSFEALHQVEVPSKALRSAKRESSEHLKRMLITPSLLIA